MIQIIERRPGENPALYTRAVANEEVDRQKRYKQILECFNDNPLMTAKECAVAMYNKGYVPTTERNFAAPRLNELSKKRCEYTGKMVMVYGVR